ncbi:hypothetical protein GCM10022225_23010 [Plantactinospora mayteni]|uniref:Uncharacterized protein n=1 Tax=Plantactinospora mayteni TaxID=566021 RepID=A0ABQ4EPE9_9ACTN|nr:hypothetical protein [Plantactinospora mayteni]GIG96485.1 hypothetical protein Pma05_30580 [Plantactinospora mayteni]
MTIMLEDSLRDMFAAQVDTPPVADDPAGTVIRRGRVTRRRRAVGSLVAVAAALVLVTAGAASLGGGWPPERRSAGPAAGFDVDSLAEVTAGPVEPPTPGPDTGIGLDLRSGDQLWTTDGRRLSLAGVGEVTRVYRVPDGWVYAGAKQVRFLRPDGTSVALSGEDDRWALSTDGDRLAFQLDTTLYLARIGANGLALIDNVEVPAGTWPVAVTADRVVVSDGSRGYGFVDLADRDRQPTRNADVTAIYGVGGDGLVGLVREVGGTRRCLASLAPTSGKLRPVRSGGCGLGLRAEATDGGLTPDGHWLAERRGAEVVLIDVDRVLAGRNGVVSCPAAGDVPPVWADDRTVVTGDDKQVVRCRTDGTEQTVSLPDGVSEDWQLVPRLTAPADGR